MAIHLVRANDDFQIYGPVIMNAEVIVYKEDIDSIRRIGIGQKREHLYKLVKDSYENIEEIVEISPIALPYSLEGGQVDGAVLDITRAGLLPKFKTAPLSENDYISYSLVVRKDIIATDVFKDFLESYNEVIDELNQKERLGEYVNITGESWDSIKIKFLSLE